MRFSLAHNSHPVRKALWCSCALLAFLSAFQVTAQRVIEMRGFKFSEYYDAPQETRVKTRLEGAKAQPLQSGSVLVSGARVQTFREDGVPELVVETPECTHNSTGRVIYSAGPLLVKTADGNFSIRGNGFQYQQTNSTLIISNNVETVANPNLLKQGATNETGTDAVPLKIRADSFRYSREDGVGLYSGHVQVSGTNLAMSSGRMLLKLPITERRLRNILSEENVQLEYAGMNANGQKAVYDVDTEVAEVTGNPSWSAEGREGKADRFVIDRTNKVVFAKGNAWLRIPGASLAANILPGFQGGRGPTNESLRAAEVSCSDYELYTNSIAFRGGVAVTEFTGAKPEGKMTSDNMTVFFTGTNEVDRLLAERNVRIEREEGLFAADEALYTATKNLLELRGSPRWQAGTRHGKGQLITVDTLKNEMHVAGNASMQMPAETLREEAGRQNIKLSDSPHAAPGVAELFSEEYFVNRDRALFNGGVYISHPQMAWSCETLTVNLPPGSGHVERVTAEQHVSFNFMDNSGQNVQGRAEQAVYQYAVNAGTTNELLRLTGNPIVQTTNAVFRNPVIVYDMRRDKVQAFGRWSGRGTAPAINTNAFKLPK